MKRSKILYITVISVLCFLMIGEPVKAAEKKDQQMTIVQVPQNLNFYLDPNNEKGHGQVYSNQYKIQNSGKEAVTFNMELSLSMLDPEAGIVFCPEEWSEEPEDRSIYMYALFEGKEIDNKYILSDPEAVCKESVVLEPGGKEGDTLYISFGGMLSQTESWKSGELAVNALYKMSSSSMGYTASVEGEHIQLKNDGEKLASGKEAVLYLLPDEGYSLPAKIQVFIGDTQAEASYDAATGKIILEKVDHDVVIYANGITRAKLPDTEVLNMDEAIWSWKVEEGIQAYEYRFLLEEETVKSGRIDVKDGSIQWNWSEELENGEYRMLLKAIGDAVYCLNSEETDYQITVNREKLQSMEEEQKEPSVEEDKQGVTEPSAEEKEQGTEEPSAEEKEQGTGEPSVEEEEQGTEEPSAEEKKQGTEKPSVKKEEQGVTEPSTEEKEQGREKPSVKKEEQEGMEPPKEGEEKKSVWSPEEGKQGTDN